MSQVPEERIKKNGQFLNNALWVKFRRISPLSKP